MGEPDDWAVIRAGGAVLWRPGGDGPEVALIHRPKYDDWTFPKGKLKNGEHLLRAVVREVYEETGLWPVLGRRLPPRWYPKGGQTKRVDYWAATVAGGTTDGGFVANGEVDRLEWLPLSAAGRRLSYERDADLLQEFAAGPLGTTPYVILRHASAGDKREWPDDDVLRPLDARGRREAGDLGELLACFGPARVISSATARCVESVLPYAARTGVEIHTDAAFTIGTPASAHAGDRLLELLADEAAAVVCGHGEMMPDLLAHACRRLGAKPPDEPGLRKGSFWVLHVARGELASAERHSCRP